MSSSAALETNDIWSKTIGLDPHAQGSAIGKEEEAAQKEHSAGLLLLVKMSNLSGNYSFFQSLSSPLNFSNKNCLEQDLNQEDVAKDAECWDI